MNSTREVKWGALASTSLGTFMVVLNGTTLMIALPALIRQLHLSSLVAVWVLLAYPVTQTVLVLTAGRLSDLYGRRSLYLAGFVFFTAMALAAGMIPSGGALIMLRALQAVGGALVMANATAIVADVFPGRQLGLALGVNSITIAIGQVIGPVLGGFLVTFWSWHWVFWFNVPVGLAGIVWAWKTIPPSVLSLRRQSLDIAGNVLYLVGLTAFLIALTAGGLYGWIRWVPVTGMALAAAGMAGFVWIEGRVAHPLLNLRLFHEHVFARASWANLFIALGRGAIVFLMVFYLQGVHGQSPLQAALAIVPFALGMGLAAPVAGMLADRWDARALSVIGALLVTAGMAGIMAIFAGLAGGLAGWLFVAGVGNGLFNSPNARQIMAAVSAGERGVASGTRIMFLNTGNVMSLAFVLAFVASTIPSRVMWAIFAGMPATVSGWALRDFVGGLGRAAAVMVLGSLLAAALAYGARIRDSRKGPSSSSDPLPASSLRP